MSSLVGELGHKKAELIVWYNVLDIVSGDYTSSRFFIFNIEERTASCLH